MLPIYTITTIPREFPHKDSRCIGWLESCHAAFQEVRNNSGDIYEEGYYHYAVIEEVTPGIYTFPRKEFWFEWSRGKDGIISPGYVILEKKPNRFNNVVCFSMG